MGRPRLYTTVEEKSAADRVKWQKYYQKNRDAICRRLRKKYKNRVNPSPPRVVSPLAALRKEVESLRKQYLKVTGGGVEQYLSQVYAQYCDNNQPATTRSDIIADALTPIETFCKALVCIQDEILQIDGIGSAWYHSEDVFRLLRRTKACLTDLSCYALEGIEEVIDAHRKGILMYQDI